MHAALFSLHILYIIFSKYIFLCITIQHSSSYLFHPIFLLTAIQHSSSYLFQPIFLLTAIQHSSSFQPSTPSFCLLLSSTLHSPYLPVHLSAYCYPALFILPIFQSIFLLTANQQSSFYLSSSPSFCLLLYSTLHPTNLPVHLPVYRYLHSTYSISSSPSFVYRYLALFILLIFQSIFLPLSQALFILLIFQSIILLYTIQHSSSY